MDIERVNASLTRAINHMLLRENAQMARALGEQDEFDDFGDIGNGVLDAAALADTTPTGDAEVGGEHGVYNMGSAEEQFYAFITDLVENLVASFGIDEDQSIDLILAFADQMAAAGDIPPIPDPTVSPASEVASWPTVAGTAGFSAKLIDFVSAELQNAEAEEENGKE